MQASLNQIPRSKPLALTGVCLLTAPIFSSLLTAVAMVKAFSTLQTAGAADPSALAGDISIALMATLYGIIIGIAGMILVSVALFRNSNRENWFYQNTIVLSVIWILIFFPAGLYLFYIFFSRRKEFGI